MRFLGLFAVGVAGVVTAILTVSLGSASGDEFVSTDNTYAITVPYGKRTGICSPADVTRFSYTIVATPPGLYNVLAVNKPTYDALIDADFNDPGLPSPLLEMSIFSPPRIVVGARVLPANRKLKAQVMCLLLDNRPPSGAPELLQLPVVATLIVTWAYVYYPATVTGPPQTITSGPPL